MGMSRSLLSCCVILGLLGGPVGAAAGLRPLRFGVLPLQSPVALARLFIPLCAHLAKALHRPIVFATAPDFQRFMARALPDTIRHQNR